MKKLTISMMMFMLLCSQVSIFGWGRKSGYQQLSQDETVAYPHTQNFLKQIQTYTPQDKALMQAVEDGNIARVNQLLNSNTFGANILIAASNIAQTTGKQEMVQLISNALNKKFVKQPKPVFRS